MLFGVIFALLAAVGFSAKAILVKLAYHDNVDAVTLLALRMAFSVPFFVGVAIWAKRQHAEALGRHDRLMVLALGLIGYYLSSLLDFLGLQYISAGLERLKEAVAAQLAASGLAAPEFSGAHAGH